jgi:hypothetical protein
MLTDVETIGGIGVIGFHALQFDDPYAPYAFTTT